MKSRPNGMQYRLACGHYISESEGGGGCDECDPLLLVDVWAVAGGDVNLNRKAETRSYRQSKFRT